VSAVWLAVSRYWPSGVTARSTGDRSAAAPATADWVSAQKVARGPDAPIPSTTVTRVIPASQTGRRGYVFARTPKPPVQGQGRLSQFGARPPDVGSVPECLPASTRPTGAPPARPPPGPPPHAAGREAGDGRVRAGPGRRGRVTGTGRG